MRKNSDKGSKEIRATRERSCGNSELIMMSDEVEKKITKLINKL